MEIITNLDNGLKLNDFNEAQRVAQQARQIVAKDLDGLLLDIDLKGISNKVNAPCVTQAKQLARYIASGAIEVTDVISANKLALSVTYDNLTPLEYARLFSTIGMQIIKWRSHTVNVLVCTNHIQPICLLLLGGEGLIASQSRKP
jgi:hypothetical protein